MTHMYLGFPSSAPLLRYYWDLTRDLRELHGAAAAAAAAAAAGIQACRP